VLANNPELRVVKGHGSPRDNSQKIDYSLEQCTESSIGLYTGRSPRLSDKDDLLDPMLSKSKLSAQNFD